MSIHDLNENAIEQYRKATPKELFGLCKQWDRFVGLLVFDIDGSWGTEQPTVSDQDWYGWRERLQVLALAAEERGFSFECALEYSTDLIREFWMLGTADGNRENAILGRAKDYYDNRHTQAAKEVERLARRLAAETAETSRDTRADGDPGRAHSTDSASDDSETRGATGRDTSTRYYLAVRWDTYSSGQPSGESERWAETEYFYFYQPKNGDLAHRLVKAFRARFKKHEATRNGVTTKSDQGVSVTKQVSFLAVPANTMDEGERIVAEDAVDELASQVSQYCAQWQIDVMELGADGLGRFNPSDPPLYDDENPLSPGSMHHQASMWEAKLAPPPAMSAKDIEDTLLWDGAPKGASLAEAFDRMRAFEADHAEKLKAISGESGQGTVSPFDLGVIRLLESIPLKWSRLDFSEFSHAEDKAFARMVEAGLIEARIAATVSMRGDKVQVQLGCRVSGDFEPKVLEEALKERPDWLTEKGKTKPGTFLEYKVTEARLTDEGETAKQDWRSPEPSFVLALIRGARPGGAGGIKPTGLVVVESCQVGDSPTNRCIAGGEGAQQQKKTTGGSGKVWPRRNDQLPDTDFQVIQSADKGDYAPGSLTVQQWRRVLDWWEDESKKISKGKGTHYDPRYRSLSQPRESCPLPGWPPAPTWWRLTRIITELLEGEGLDPQPVWKYVSHAHKNMYEGGKVDQDMARQALGLVERLRKELPVGSPKTALEAARSEQREAAAKPKIAQELIDGMRRFLKEHPGEKFAAKELNQEMRTAGCTSKDYRAQDISAAKRYLKDRENLPLAERGYCYRPDSSG